MDDALEPNWKRPLVLVTGVDNALGANLALHLATRLAVVGFSRNRPVSLEGCDTIFWEPANATDVARRVRQVSPQWILHCGPIACGSWDTPENLPDGSQETATSLQLARLAADAAIRLTVISTDAVFAGPRIFHDEDAVSTNSQPLAQAARQVEQALQAMPALVVRTHAYGWSGAGAEPGFAERAWQALTDGLPRWFDPNDYATPILATDLAYLLWRAYQGGLTGLRHIAGAERVSAYRFVQELAAVFDLPSCPLPSERVVSEPSAPLLSQETSLNTRRAQRELQQPMPLLREGLERFARQLHSGPHARLRSIGHSGDVRGHAA